MNKQIEEALKKLSEWNMASFERKGKDFNFSDVFPLILRIHQAFLDYRDNPEFEDTIPSDKLSTVNSLIKQMITNFESINTFDPTNGGDPNSRRNEMVEGIKNVYNRLYPDFFIPFQLYLLKKNSESSGISKIVNDAQNDFQEIVEQKKEAQKILDGIRDAALEAGSSKFAQVFEDQAKRNRNTANVWLIVSIVFGGGILLTVYSFFIEAFTNIEKAIPLKESLPVIASRFIFVSLMTAFFYQMIKNLNSNMHLFMVNRHKANCLTVLQSMVESGEDPRTREAVLMQASRAIFEFNETGFINSKEKEISGLETVRIVEQLSRH